MTTLWGGQARSLRVPRFAEDAVERARLAVVPRQRRSTAPRVPFAILVGLVLLGGVAGLLMFNTHMQQNSFALTSLETRADELHAREQQLRMQLDQLRDPQQLMERAKQMGMVAPDSPVFLHLAGGTVTGKATPSTGVNDFSIKAPEARKPSSINPPPLVLPRLVIRPDEAATGAANTGSAADTGTKKSHRD